MNAKTENKNLTGNNEAHLVSSCCKSSELIPPDYEMAEEMGSLYSACTCYICKKCGKACDVIELSQAIHNDEKSRSYLKHCITQ
jgi:hypothetical protein